MKNIFISVLLFILFSSCGKFRIGKKLNNKYDRSYLERMTENVTHEESQCPELNDEYCYSNEERGCIDLKLSYNEDDKLIFKTELYTDPIIIDGFFRDEFEDGYLTGNKIVGYCEHGHLNIYQHNFNDSELNTFYLISEHSTILHTRVEDYVSRIIRTNMSLSKSPESRDFSGY